MSHPRRQHTRERLIHAAITVFARRGYGAATVAHVCQEAGYTRGAFYSNFETKADLCLAVLAEFLAARDRAIEAVAALLVDFHDPVAATKQAIDTFFRGQDFSPEAIVALSEIRLAAHRDQELGQAVMRLERQGSEPLQHMLRGALAATGHEFVVDVGTVFQVLESIILDGVIRPLPHTSLDDVTAQAADVAVALVRPIRAAAG